MLKTLRDIAIYFDCIKHFDFEFRIKDCQKYLKYKCLILFPYCSSKILSLRNNELVQIINTHLYFIFADLEVERKCH